VKPISVLGSMLVLALLGAAGQTAAQESVLDVTMRVVEDASSIDAVVIELREGTDAGHPSSVDDGARARGARAEANDDGQDLIGDDEPVDHGPDENAQKRSNE